MVKLVFCTSSKPGAAVIRLVTWSKWSHVALIDGDDVIEAVGAGVRRIPLSELISTHPKYEIVEFPCENPQAVIDAAKSQIGKSYDFTALLGLYLHRDWQEEDKWYCAELVAWAFDKAGFPLLRADALHRVTPQHLWMLPPKSTE